MAGFFRIAGGRLKRRLFKAPKEADLKIVRPISSRAREAIFSSIHDKTHGAFVLDIFAGSGAYGIEAISRGAKKVIFIEKNINVSRNLKKNIDKLNIAMFCDTKTTDAFKFIEKSDFNQLFDLIFLDPPYSISIADFFWKKLLFFLKEDGLLIFRHDPKVAVSVPLFFKIVREKVYGGTKVLFLKKSNI